jgi:surface polysaccharide O-acyltransferase-like enzyme
METMQKPMFSNTADAARAVWIDALRLISVSAVVGLHAAVPAVLSFGKIHEFDWWIGNIFDSSVRWCVPVFVMITGALLLNPRHRADVLGFYRKKIPRIPVPLVFWSVLYGVLACVIDVRAHRQIEYKLLILKLHIQPLGFI